MSNVVRFDLLYSHLKLVFSAKISLENKRENSYLIVKTVACPSTCYLFYMEIRHQMHLASSRISKFFEVNIELPCAFSLWINTDIIQNHVFSEQVIFQRIFLFHEFWFGLACPSLAGPVADLLVQILCSCLQNHDAFFCYFFAMTGRLAKVEQNRALQNHAWPSQVHKLESACPRKE